MATPARTDEKADSEDAPSRMPVPGSIFSIAAISNLSFRSWSILFVVVVGAVGGICGLVWGPGMDFPAEWGRPIGQRVDRAVDWLLDTAPWLFDGIKWLLLKLLVWLKDFLLWVPWPAIVVAVGLVAWRVSSVGLGIFCSLALLAIGLMGRLPDNPVTLWEASMATLALILVSVFLSLLIGIPLGVLAAKNQWADNISRPILDGAQTMPSFVYLVPALLFFGLGAVPATIATVIYAVPPVIRLTNLGIRQVSPQTVEAARSFGATSLQLLVKVQIPMAIPTIMAGVNQTTMLALSMVVVASLVGGGGLGEVVLRALGRQEPGNGLLGGLAIVAIAIVIDRITQALTKSKQEALSGGG